jgi:hypothetical protein
MQQGIQDHRSGAHDDETINMSIDCWAQQMQVSGLRRAQRRLFRKPLLRSPSGSPASCHVDGADVDPFGAR